MKITACEIWSQRMTLATPYAIAGQTFAETTNVFIRLETDRRIVGHGCAAPEPGVTGEHWQQTERVLEAAAHDAVRGANALDWRRLLERLKPDLLPAAPAALAAIDMAVLDLVAGASGLPLYQALGGFRDHIATSITIGILDEAQTVERARQRVEEGFSALKLKGGNDVEQDIARVLKVREALGARIELRFDANQGYSLAQCQRFLAGVESANLSLIEQPIPRGHPDTMGKIRDGATVPVMADESLLDLRDAFRLARNEVVDMVNIKLMKVGGIAEAMQIGAVARAGRLGVMVGCMDESALAIAAGLHFCLAQPAVQLADLDGHLDLQDDPFAGMVVLRKGCLYPNKRPGLGVPG